MNLKFKALKIIRPLNCLMASLAVFIGITLASNFFSMDLSFYNSIIALFVAFFITGAGNTINDYYDYKIDSYNAPNRPIPSGIIKRKEAFLLSITLFLVGISLSYFINWFCFSLALFNSLILFFYARNLKGVPLSGNVSVSYLVGSTFLFGALVVSEVKVTLVLFLLATLSTLGREIAKDLEDVEGDKEKVKTIATEYGEKISANIASFSTLLAVLLSPIPFILGYLGIIYLLIVLVADSLFIFGIKELLINKNQESAHYFQKISKYAMLISLVSFLVGSFGFT
ncbi:digeranylgeranylglyceryl phosphate synthase [archaeon SCG-AAA382B04]|nr:digeranylgeranylglyceryl phosphate synthase [archaeon SCG-AAA382B04]